MKNMNRIDKLFRLKNKKILSVFFTAGHPTLDSTVGIIMNLEKAGADMLEIGMPFSDPIADGPVIQKSSVEALQNGMNIRLLFEQLEGIRKHVSIPLLLMGYINPVLKFGIEEFCHRCAETGIDGVILPDLPPEIYIEKYSRIFEENNLYNILLVTPQLSDERIRMIDSTGKGFNYIVSSYSTTGGRGSFTEEQLSYFRRLDEMKLKNPGLIGFGISDRETFETACNNARGAIIGSAFVKMLDENGVGPENIKKFVEAITR